MDKPSNYFDVEEHREVCYLKRSLYDLKKSQQALFGKFIEVV